MPMQVRLLSETSIRSVAPTLPDIVALVEQAYRLDAEGKAEVPTKIAVHPQRANTFLHAMPAWVGDARALGMKWVSYFPGNFARGLPDSSGVIILNDPDHGLPVCIMEGMYVTFLRTAACAAVAAKYLAARPPKTLGLIGCGGLGRWTLRVMSAVFPSIEHVLVSSRTRGSREAFCAEMTGQGAWTIAPVDDPLQAVRNMDIVVTSIPPGDARPVAGDALAPGTILIPLDLVNSWQDDVLRAADRVLADHPANFSARIQATRASALPALKAPARTQDLVVGRLPRAAISERSVVAVCGIASTDVVVAWEIYRRAKDANVGLEFDLHG
jgi:ornithine cyclodeaminase/alanine dehydrogenase-like protein (mu-crystallin family)